MASFDKSLTDKYRPKTTKEIIGQKKQLDEIRSTIVKNSENTKKRKALLLIGPTGTGKTSAIHALANELDLEIIEVNASDVRNTQGLEEKIFPAMRQQSLFSRGKIILIDEIDGLSGTGDRGGIPTIVKIVEESTFPIILTANDVSDYKYNSIKKVSVIVEFGAISFLDMLSHLKKICETEGIKFEEDALSHLARSSSGDMRSALNDLQNISYSGKITRKDVEGISTREREDTIINALLKIFKTKNSEIALGAFENVDMDIDQLFLWLDENLPKEYLDTEDLATAYDNLSVADIYFGRIRRWQYYRYYVYIYNLLSAGIALSKKEKNSSFIKYGPTTRLLKIWMINQKTAKKKSIAAKIALKIHTSKKTSYENMAFIKAISQDEKLLSKFKDEFKLEDEEMVWFSK